MRNTYKIIDYQNLGLPSIEVFGENFHYQDLYELVGKEQYMTTFQLRKNSESYREYGVSVLGVIYYDRKSIDKLNKSLVDKNEVQEVKIRVDCPSLDMSSTKKCNLKYKGINVADIENISFLPYKRKIEKHETGEKKIPNVIEIEADLSGTDVDILNQNYLVSKNNHGTNLILFEKEQLIGITLAINNGRIDKRILKHFGFNENNLKTNLNIWMSLYKVKERRNQLSDIDNKQYSEIKEIISIEKFAMVTKEILNAGLMESISEAEKDILRKIFKSVEDFSPSILLHGKNQVYWDLESYLHIALRHLKNYQLGNFQNKTPFPYRADDLESLIEKVLRQVEDEIEQYFLEKPTNDFTRHGKMAIFFNGDHYHLRINREGKLKQFHMVEPTFNL
jgi:hypothetical protein